jgi:predicted PurR-regulated permease PerM
LNLDTIPRIGLNLLALLGGILALHLGQSIIIPTIIALLLAAMLWPAVVWMNQFLRFSWGFASLTAVTGLVILNILVSLGFLLAIPKLLQDLPDLRDHQGQELAYQTFRKQIGTVIPLDDNYFPVDPQKSTVFRYVKESLEGSSYIPYALWESFKYGNLWFWVWVLIMFLLLFMLWEGPTLTRRFVDIFGPSEEAKARAVQALTHMANQVRTYLVWRTIINFGVALTLGLLYSYVFHLKQPWTWAMLSAILFYVPYLGPLAAGVFPVIDAFFSVSPLAALGVIGVYMVVLTVEGYIVFPLVMGHNLALNATTVMLACLFWELVWGLPGLFLAMPLMAAVKAVFQSVPDWRPWANLMSTPKAEIAARSQAELVISPLDATQVLTAEELKAVSAARRSLAEPK